MAAVAASLPALALVMRVLTAAGLEVPVSGFGFFSLLTATVGFQFVAPMLALVYSSGVIIDELEAGTLTYLITRPAPRSAVLAGKLLGSLLIQALLLLPSLVLCFYLAVAPAGWQELGTRFPILARDIAAALLGLAAYSGLFGLAGTVLRRPVLAGLIFVFGYQAVATYVPGLVRQLTVAHYLQSLLPHESFQGALSGFVGGRASTGGAVVVLLSIAAVAHGLAALAFSRRQFPGRE
jgi:ABC-type transport system involved in multi-copper enzyme maturation permease subunit